MKQTLQSIFTIVLSGAAIISSNNASAQKSIKLSLVAGQKFQTENVVKTTTSMEMMGQQMDVVADVTATRQLEVKDKKESTYNITSTITKMATVTNMMGQEIKYDSEKKEDQDSEIGKVLADKINVPVEMEMNETGKVTKVKKQEGKDDKNGMAAMMGGMGAGADESGLVEDVFLSIPEGAKQDDKWSDSTIADGVKTYRNFTVKSIEGSNATLTFAATQNINKAVENQGMEMNITMENKMTGEILVDKTTGVVKQKTINTEGTGSMDMMGQSVPMTNKTTLTSTTKGL